MGSVLAQSPEPEARDKVLDNNPDLIGIWKCWFLRRVDNRNTRRKTSRSKDEKPNMTSVQQRTAEGTVSPRNERYLR